MLTFDRIVLAMLALGIWVLVLSPRSIEANHSYSSNAGHGHDCEIDGGRGAERSAARPYIGPHPLRL